MLLDSQQHPLSAAEVVDIVDAYCESASDSDSVMSTWQSSSTGGSSIGSSMLDEHDTNDVLVYRYRCGAPRLDIETQQKLSKALKTDPRFRISKKRIPRGNSRVDVRMEDIFTDDERPAYADKPNYRSSLASVGLPSQVYWRRLLFNAFPDLYIVSPVSSPETTPESSQNVSPSNTFPPTHAAGAAGDSMENSQESAVSATAAAPAATAAAKDTASRPNGVVGSE